MKRTFLTTLLITAPVYAQDAVSSTTSSPTRAAVPITITLLPTAAESPGFLHHRGIVSSEQLLGDLKTSLTPQQRTQIERALAKRNAALHAANVELSATLSAHLGESHEGISRRLQERADQQRLDDIRRRQPQRYFYFLEQMKKRQKAQAQ